MRIHGYLAAIAVSALAGCGGGGSAVDAAATALTSNMVPITEQTAEATAAAVVKSIDGAFDAGESALDFGAAIGARIEGDSAGAAGIALDMAMQARETATSASFSTAVGAVITQGRDCLGGGTATVSMDTGSLSEQEFTDMLLAGSIPPGTSIRTEFMDCIEGDETLDGAVTIVIQQLSLEGEIGLDTFTIQFSATFEDFQSDELSIDGDISVLLVSDAGGTDAQISGSSLEVSASGETLEMLNYAVTAVEDPEALVETFDFTLDVTLGQLIVETLVELRTLAFAENPISGTLRILGADDASITIVALDEVNVQLDVDTDGDGVTDVTIMTTWDELDA